ncbi:MULTISPECIES: hypothetical protein [unclassified Neisseria]|uniref:hypothetical protein n=1 Tax=unclassified Neisseria TaxID=2623750 RepID=UPI001072DDA0|nr:MULTISPECIES: hypothetical protein [unclassified Neisseria]MBF0803445.1 hypothetical protein [Neisseria sp. 19428wB4_WF04]TFU43846.1 hypothetical protein E4T99_03605 [Neisseria sp. WF04]
MNIWQKTFGGLSPTYYIRQFLFGLIFPAFFFFMGSQIGSGYESIVGYIMGENMFFVNALLMLLVKIFTMLLCWMFAVFIAPIGLIYLYFYHSRQEKLSD